MKKLERGEEDSTDWAELTKLSLERGDWNLIRGLRLNYGADIPQPEGGWACLDYALERSFYQSMDNEPYRVLAGERSFLMCCFSQLMRGRMDRKTRLAFYLYLLLKIQFRSELIQVNRHVGFQNFSDYQTRKTWLFEQHSCYRAELMRMALNAPLSSGSVVSLETRMSPPKSTRETYDRVAQADKLMLFADRDQSIGICPERKPDRNSPFFYVFHYTKCKDEDWSKRDRLAVICRHHKLRKRVRTQSVAMAQALSNSSYLRQRIRGIDCASNEIGCPPEVFAQAYRFMRGYKEGDFCRENVFVEKETRRLCATYHVGEDFLDIASALRAIDEAVKLLGLQRGDRIGHALGLGVSPELHYSQKGHCIYLSKQERLDDLVWILYRSRELDLHIDAHLYGLLKEEAETLLIEIYGDAMHSENWHIGLTDYYCAMKLRGDDPQCYREKVLRRPRDITPYESFALIPGDETLDTYRNYEPYQGLYFYYHYDLEVKRRGSQVVSREITLDYIHLMSNAQQKLQEELERRGIIVECNPSSNVLIGTFENYREHPIFRFHNLGLEPDAQGPQLEVCINTDDLGVFDTSLEFEYALLFDALIKEHKPDGTRKYRQEQILHYLEQLRCMGHCAVFPAIQENSAR